MLSRWFRPRCTVDPVTRAWLDDRRAWLARQFPTPPDDRRTVLPTAAFFPDPYDRSPTAVRRLAGRVCDYMGVDRDAVDVQLFENVARNLHLVDGENRAVSTGPAGTYHRGDTHSVIRLERRQADDPMSLVGTVAHELAHVRLMGEGRVDGDEFDNELLTDLTVVHLGLGIFLANVPRHWDSHTSRWPGTDVPMPRYMTTPMYGYSLAARSVEVGERRPPWRRCLRPGIRAEVDAAARFLRVDAAGRRG